MNFLNQLLNVPSTDPDHHRRARLLNILLLGVTVLTILSIATVTIKQLFTSEDTRLAYLSSGIVLSGNLIIFLINRYRSGPVAAWLFLGLITTAISMADQPHQVVAGRSLFLLSIPVLMAGVLLPSYTSFIMAGLVGLVINTISFNIQLGPRILPVLGFFTLALIAWLSARSLEQALADLRRLSQAHQENAARLAGILDIALEGIISIDDQQQIMLFNSGAEQIFGYTAAEMIGQPLSRLVPERLRTSHHRHIVEFGQSTEVARPMEQRSGIIGRRQNGQEFPMEASISKLQLVNQTIFTVVLRDITERVQAAEKLQASEERYRMLVETMNQGLSVRDTDGLFTYANDRFCNMIGYERQEFIGQPISNFLDQANQKVLQGQMNSRNEGQGDSFELTFTQKDGQKIPTIISAQPIYDQAGHNIGAFAVITDISRQKRVEAELKQHQEHLAELVNLRTAELVDANQQLQCEIGERLQAEEQIKAALAEKEILLQEIHHRVKNNLQTVSSLLHLQENQLQDQQTRHLFQECRNRIKSMTLVHEHLYQTKNLSRIDFSDYAENLILQLRRSYLTPNVGLQTAIASVTLSLEQAIPCGLIINELISNALKHAFPNGRTGQIEIAVVVMANHQLKLRIADDGVGFPRDYDARQTSSLGLTLVYTLVKQLRGTITRLDQAGGTIYEIIFNQPAD